ncbi:MAG: O-antigen polymerase [Solirubrobacterales bacterium]|nr:O-antigen polymerase [Solirubrobacterales bacterium]
MSPARGVADLAPGLWARRPQGDPRGLVAVLGIAGAALLLGWLAGAAPKLALGATLGVAFLVAVMSDLALGLCLFIILAFFEVLPAVAGGFTFAKIGGLLLVVSWLATVAVRPKWRRDFLRVHPAATALMVGFLCWIAMSAAWAESPSVALGTLPRYAPNLVLFLIVYTAVGTRRHAVWVIAAFVIGATIAALYGIARPPSPNSLRGDRIGGIVGDPNELASVLVAGLVLAVALAAVLRQRTLGRVAAGAAACVILLAIFLTLSRGGLLALGVVLVVGIFSAGRWRVMAIVLALVATLGTVTYFSEFASPVARQRVTTAGNGSGRTGLWTVAWRMVDAHPVRGVGAGNFPVSSVHYLLRPGAIPDGYFIVDRPEVTHNVYLQLLAETGLVGLSLFLGLIAFAVSSALKAARAFKRRGDHRLEVIARAAMTAQIGVLTADFFISAQYNKQLWILLALGPALLALARAAPGAARS